MKETRLKRHHDRAHSRNAAARRGAKKRTARTGQRQQAGAKRKAKSSKVWEAARLKGLKFKTKLPRPEADERGMDGSAEFWWLRREQGRFGSHPAHDDFDSGA